MSISLNFYGQTGYGNNWVLGYNTTETSGTILDFNQAQVSIFPVQKDMFLEGSIAVISDSIGNLLFYSNGCFIANGKHNKIINSDSIGLGKLETSFCMMGGNPMTQGIIALPGPFQNDLYYLFYTDIQSPYEFPTGLYFPLAPLNLYYCIIDMNKNNGEGEIVIKNQILVSDTLSRGMIEATKHENGHDWWIIIPKSHSNCYYTIRLSKNGVDTSFLQCTGKVWGDNDATGQVVFSPNGRKYVRSNFFNGLNIFDFDFKTGLLSSPINFEFEHDTFYYSGASFSSNSRFLYITAFDKIFQFDIKAENISASKVLIGELVFPPNISTITRFNQSILAPDGKIYIGGTSTYTYLHVIHNPNCKGTDCNLEQYALETPSYNVYGMPNMPHYLEWNEADTCDSTVNIIVNSSLDEFVVFPNPFREEVHVEGNFPFSILVFDSFGKQVYSKEFETKSGSFSLDNYSNGLYSYQIIKKNGERKIGMLIKIE